MSLLQTSWQRCWHALSATGDGAAHFQWLMNAYQQPQRKYHTLQHLEECLRLLDANFHLAERPAEVEMALWFHDAVYDVKGSSNEAQSAQAATDALLPAGVDQAAIERIGELILATRHAVLPTGTDQQLLVDIDLAILGAEPQRFAEYELQIREEYRWVPKAEFCRKRSEILQMFLARTPLYHTPPLRQQLQEQAHGNLRLSIQQLQMQMAAS